MKGKNDENKQTNKNKQNKNTKGQMRETKDKNRPKSE